MRHAYHKRVAQVSVYPATMKPRLSIVRHTLFEFPFELDGNAAPALADWDLDGDLDLERLDQLRRLAEGLLANTVIESYQVELA